MTAVYAVTTPLLFQPTPDAVYGFPNARLIERVDTPHQRIEIWDTPQLGTLFTLDGRPMTSAADEFIHHECMVQPAALAHAAPRAALVLGGGDGGAARQLLKHPTIERVVVAELDAEVVRLTRAWLPTVHGNAFDDPRVELVIGDAADYVERTIERHAHADANAGANAARPAQPDAPTNHTIAPNASAALAPPQPFDLVIFDLTPPDSPAASLYTPAFYQRLKQTMSPDATISVHLGSPYFHAPRIAGLLRDLGAAFATVRTLGAFVPLYGSLWLMAIASDTLDPAATDSADIARRLAARGIDGLRYYDASTHLALFSAARMARAKLGQFLKPC